MAWALTIAGATKEPNPGIEVRKTANGRAVFTCKIFSEDGSYRPALDADVVLTESGNPIFGGVITQTEEAGFAENMDAPIETEVIADDNNTLVKRQYVNEVIPSGTLKSFLTVLVAYIEGATLDPAQVNGPTLEAMEWQDVNLENVLNQLSDLTNGEFVWKVDPSLVFGMYESSTVPAPFNISPGATTLLISNVRVRPTRRDYFNSVIVRTKFYRKTAEDAGEIASNGRWTAVFAAPDETPEAGVQALADSLLARGLVVLKELDYFTWEDGLEPGQTQTIDLPERNVNNTFLITEVVIRDHGDQIGYDVSAVEGVVYRTGWRETYRRWNGDSGIQSVGGAIGGGTLPIRFAYPLNTDVLVAVQSSTPTWVPATGGALGAGAFQVQIDTVPRGTTSATIVARLRARDAGVTVRARLYDVTDSVACPGLSSVVTNTNWETVSWSVTLTAGSHLYELQLLPGTANADVQGTGYLV